jgi:CHAT domain-containing protein
VHWLPDATRRASQGALRRGPRHIFHFVGRGGFDSNTDEGLIAIVDEKGVTFRLAVTELARLLGDNYPQRLAVLNACEGARGISHDPFSSIAATLVRRGTPAVVAMQHEITDRAGIEFGRSLALSVVGPRPAGGAEGSATVRATLIWAIEWTTARTRR